MEEKILEKLKDKKFAGKILACETKEEVMKAFSQEGIEISEKEVELLEKIFSDMISKLCEMSESQLEKISGGIDPANGGFRFASSTDSANNVGFVEGVVKGAIGYYMKPGNLVGEAIMDELPGEGDSILSDCNIANLAAVGVIALQTYGIYKGGKWAINKGKQWWNNRKQKQD